MRPDRTTAAWLCPPSESLSCAPPAMRPLSPGPPPARPQVGRELVISEGGLSHKISLLGHSARFCRVGATQARDQPLSAQKPAPAAFSSTLSPSHSPDLKNQKVGKSAFIYSSTPESLAASLAQLFKQHGASKDPHKLGEHPPFCHFPAGPTWTTFLSGGRDPTC